MDPSFLGMMQRKGLTAWQFNMNSGFLMCSSVCRLAHPEPLVWLVEENWRATNAALGHACFFGGKGSWRHPILIMAHMELQNEGAKAYTRTQSHTYI